MKSNAKIIKLPTAHINDWVEGCKKQDPLAQSHVFHRYAPVLLGICRRYLHNLQDAEDILMEAFQIVFTRVNDYTGQGSFEGWMKRITINQCLMFLRKNKLQFTDLESMEAPAHHATVLDQIYESEILQLLDLLPTGYRTIFNLYVIEGYKHKEIAEMLDISINTSKSQLILARKRMAQVIINRNKDEKTTDQ